MAAPFGYVRWHGIDAHGPVQFTLLHGIKPSQCQIQIAAGTILSSGGTLSLNFGNVSINFPDCRADLIDVERSQEGALLWTVTVLDRRWKWESAAGAISGYYNVREGKAIKSDTKKHVKDLMDLCLKAMGEKRYDISTVPRDVFPETEWEYMNPSEALAQLADTIGYRIVYRPGNDTVAVLKAGEGKPLQQLDAVEYSGTFNPPERPDSITFVGERAKWEMDLELEAVAQDTDFSYVLLNDVSYTPVVDPKESKEGGAKLTTKHFWWNYDVYLNGLPDVAAVDTPEGQKTLKDFARQSVYRAYRIVTPIKVPNIEMVAKSMGLKLKEVSDLKQLLPLGRERLATYTDPETKGEKPKKAIVWGNFYKGGSTTRNNRTKGIKQVDEKDGTPPLDLTYNRGFQIDAEKGIVLFDEPVFEYVEPKTPITIEEVEVKGKIFWPARLKLRIAFGIRDPDSRAWLHLEVERKLPGRKFGTRSHYIKKNDVALGYIVGKGGKLEPRTGDGGELQYLQAGSFYLDQQIKTYEIKDPAAATYPGLKRIDPDGAIQQITWSISERGTSTRVSRNREEPVLGLTYAEQRLYQEIAAKIDADPQSGRQQDDRSAKRP